MDCCNYMQYRHQQPYYDSQYYPFHGGADLYPQQLYQEYYGGPYYTQQWPCAAASFPDYVYNPKEARIRKAMRDATRERSIGTSPMLSRPNARRASTHSWMSPHDELMMSPLANMRGAMEPPVCGFPLSSSTGNDQFMGAMNGYNKMEPPPPMPPTSSVHTDYMQSNPLAQLQQHTELWTDYQNMRPRSSGNPYMMDVPSYPNQNPEIAAPIMMEKQPTPTASPHNNEAEQEKESTNMEPTQEDNFMAVFEQNDDNKMKKPAVPQIRNNTKKSTNNKPLPDFNEAFGSTERGRFQSPPDPRLAPNKGYLEYFFDSTPIKFDDYQI